MKRIAFLFVIVLAAFGFTLFANANSGCCLIQQHGSPAATK